MMNHERRELVQSGRCNYIVMNKERLGVSSFENSSSKWEMQYLKQKKLQEHSLASLVEEFLEKYLEMWFQAEKHLFRWTTSNQGWEFTLAVQVFIQKALHWKVLCWFHPLSTHTVGHTNSKHTEQHNRWCTELQLAINGSFPGQTDCNLSFIPGWWPALQVNSYHINLHNSGYKILTFLSLYIHL